MTWTTNQKRRSRDIKYYVNIRKATQLEDEEVLNLINGPQPVSPEYDLKPEIYQIAKIRRSGVVLVLEIGFQIVGTCSLIFPETKLCESWKPNAAYFKFLSIHPNYQGLGFAKILLHEIQNVAQDHNYRHICVRLITAHRGLSYLFEASGYRKDFFGDIHRNGKDYLGFTLELCRLAVV